MIGHTQGLFSAYVDPPADAGPATLVASTAYVDTSPSYEPAEPFEWGLLQSHTMNAATTFAVIFVSFTPNTNEWSAWPQAINTGTKLLFGGQECTPIARANNTLDQSGSALIEAWYIHFPLSGAQNFEYKILDTGTGGGGTDDPDTIHLHVLEFSGAGEADPPYEGLSSNNSNGATSLSVTTTPVSASFAVSGVCCEDDPDTTLSLTSPASATVEENNATGNVNAATGYRDTAGAKTFTWDFDSQSLECAAIAFHIIDNP